MFARIVRARQLKQCKYLSQHIRNREITDLDVNYICDERNINEIATNIKQRKGVGDIHCIHDLQQKITNAGNDQTIKELQNQLLLEMLKIPNKTHASVDFAQPKEVHVSGTPRQFDFKPRDFQEITKRMQLARTEHLGNVVGTRSYVLYGDLVVLEQALIKYTLERLQKAGFQLISVPDIVHRDAMRSCNMDTDANRTQVYTLDEQHGQELCLSGTSEIAIARYFSNRTISHKNLPQKLCAVSRCYRAETSHLVEERGIYRYSEALLFGCKNNNLRDQRVHQFTKVEMFAVTLPSQSDAQQEEFRRIEESLFADLGLHFKTLDMPAHELGASSYRKYDIEAWMPGRNIFGEISSCSNCTDYQSRRLGIKFRDEDAILQHPHTVNGTACAIPRMLIALVENYQNDNGTIDIPAVLQPFFGKSKIFRQKGIPELKLIKNKT